MTRFGAAPSPSLARDDLRDPLSFGPAEWFPAGVARLAAAGPGPGDEDEDEDDESGGSVGNIDPDDDEGYGDDEEDDEEDTLWAGVASSSPPNRL